MAHLGRLGAEFYQAVILAALWPHQEQALQQQARLCVMNWRNPRPRQQSLAWMDADAPPQVHADAAQAQPSGEALHQALRAALTIADERLVRRALHNLQQSDPSWRPLMPFAGDLAADMNTNLARLATLNEEQQAKLILEIAPHLDAAQAEQVLQVSWAIRDEWYRAVSLAAFLRLPGSSHTQLLIREIRRCLVWFMWRRADRQREYLLHFLASYLLFTPPILPQAMTDAIRQQVHEITQRWYWEA